MKFFATNATDPLHWIKNFCLGAYWTVSLRHESRCKTGQTSAINAQVLGPMEWIRCIHCEKFRRNLIYWTCALMATGRPVLHRLSCSNEMVRNGFETYFGSNGVDQVRSLWKILTQIDLVNLCVIFSKFCTDFCAVMKRFKMPPKHEFWVQWSGSGAFVAKNSNFWTCVLMASVWPALHWLSGSNEMVWNAAKTWVLGPM
jgi:hypothetical protein